MQIKDIRNRRAHEISETLPITARQAYTVADCMCRVFEAMSINVPVNFHQELWHMRLCAQYLLNVEELHKIQQYIESGADQTFILPIA